jgi:hypothetical protein
VIRISLGSMPSLLREIVASALATQSDFEIGEQHDQNFDVLLVCTGGGEEARLALAAMLRDVPPAIVALDPNGEQASILRLDCRHEDLSAPGDLCGVVRQAATAQHGTRH